MPTALAQAPPALAAASRQWQHFPEPPRAPANAPNVLLIMTDDVGFAAASAFGGMIPTPTFDALAQHGLRYNQFHTTSLCSPTRAALLTGRNHHAVASGQLTNLAFDAPGYTSVIPQSAATVARVLRDNGYATAMFGKNHNIPLWEMGPTGPFERWPNGMGFDYFYGFNDGWTDQFHPHLIENRTQVEPSRGDANYILDRDLADHLIQWLRSQGNLRPDQPFFAYLASGAMHGPQQAPAEWIARFRGRFDVGWDRAREQIFARQKAMGVIPHDAKLTPRPEGLPAWTSLSADERRVYARMMEVAAAQLAFCDDQIGRVIEELRRSGELDNTLIIYIQGDNGAAAPSPRGSFNQMVRGNGLERTTSDLLQHLDAFGGPNSFTVYPAAWAWAMNTPFQWAKSTASHFGGVRNGLVISWNGRIRGAGVRPQFHHVIDIAPTIYEAAGITPPTRVDGVEQQPIDGVSMIYSFDNANAPSVRREQYFTMFANRAFYRDGWIASTTPLVKPWDSEGPQSWNLSGPPIDPDAFAWELYDLRTDYSQARNLAAKHPERLTELRAGFEAAAQRYHVYPLAVGGSGGRPDLLGGRNAYTYYPGETIYPSMSFPALRPGTTATARVRVTDPGAAGPVLIVGSQVAGLRFRLEGGRAIFAYDPTGRANERLEVRTATPLKPGPHSITVRFERAGSEGSRAASVSLRADDEAPVSASIPVFYPVRGDTFIGREGTEALSPGGRSPAPHGYVLEALDIRTGDR